MAEGGLKKEALTNSRIVPRVPLLIAVCLVGIPAQAKYGGGSGTAEDPYQIATAEDLMLLGESPEDYDKHFILTDDIDLDPNLPDGKVFDKAIIAPMFPTIAYPYWQGTPFTGVFDGKGHTISNLTITGSSYLGLFGQLGKRKTVAEVRNVSVVDANITGSGGCVGGLVGMNYGTLTHCHSIGTVSGDSSVGGLVGLNELGSIATSYSTGAVSGNENVGGLVGYFYYGDVTNCYSTGMVSGTERIGGLVGWNIGDVGDSYSTGAVRGASFVGGLVGCNYGEERRSPQPRIQARIFNSYSSGMVIGTGEYVGGLVGEDTFCGMEGCGPAWNVNVSHSFWDIETSGQSESGGGTGKTTAEMQTASTFLDAGWDFVGETANGSDDIWKIAEDLGYPRLWWEKYSGGTGEPNDPYQIATAADLIALGETPEDYDKHFILTEDIDLDPNLPGCKVFDKAVIAPDTDPSTEWFSEGTSFTGTFDGASHTISHLRIKGGGFLGLFGELGSWWDKPSAGEVKDLGVVEVNITGSDLYVGGLVGSKVYGNVARCYSTGAVSGRNYVGGLIGVNGDTVTECYSSAVVSGNSSVGGLVGYNGAWDEGLPDGRVCRCYSTGAVTGNNYVGGLVGGNQYRMGYGEVTGCYSTGMVSGQNYVGGLIGIVGRSSGHVTDCFWDIQTSGTLDGFGEIDPDPNGVIGKTTAEMQTASTFLNAGWDFVNVWGIGENQTYPYLRKYSAADINRDASVNFLDLAALAESWLTGMAP
jgi:hypothetical protein